MRHLCDNKACINPEHIEWAPWADNQRDRAYATRSGRQVLRPNDVRDIRRRHWQESHNVSNTRALAEEYGVTKVCIHNIIRGKSWAWLD